MKIRKKTKLYIYGFLTLFVMAAIFYLSAQDTDASTHLSEGFLKTVIGNFLGRFLPNITDEGIYHDVRKYAHVFEYFCLGVTSCLFYNELILNRFNSALLSSGLSFVYACSDEWHQTFVPGRSGQISDVFVDFTGIIIGVLTVTLLCVAIKNKNSTV